jgi:hypothetical protein
MVIPHRRSGGFEGRSPEQMFNVSSDQAGYRALYRYCGMWSQTRLRVSKDTAAWVRRVGASSALKVEGTCNRAVGDVCYRSWELRFRITMVRSIMKAMVLGRHELSIQQQAAFVLCLFAVRPTCRFTNHLNLLWCIFGLTPLARLSFVTLFISGGNIFIYTHFFKKATRA